MIVDLFSRKTATQPAELPRQTSLRLMEGAAVNERFAEVAALAAAFCNKPWAAVVLLDDAACHPATALPSDAMPLLDALSRATLLVDDVMVVEDTQADSRFEPSKSNDGIRAFAGVTLCALGDRRIGVLCVMDSALGTLTATQVQALEVLGRQLNARLQLRDHAALAETMTAERALESASFSTILNSLPVEVYLKDSVGRVQFYNRKVAERFGISSTDWIGKTSHDLWDEPIAAKIASEDAYVLRSGQPHESFVELPKADGKPGYWHSMTVPCELPDGGQLLASCSVDITTHMERERRLQATQDDLQEANRKLNSLALTDALTGLWNRRAFDARLGINIIAAQRNKLPMALIMLDIDNFKSINDSFGHGYGDEVLKQVAEILNSAKRAEDVACRFGGEEFSILLPGTGIEGAQSLSRRILKNMGEFPWEQGGPVTMSLGVSICSATSASTCSAEALVNAADSALYRAKHEGKNRMMVYDGLESA